MMEYEASRKLTRSRRTIWSSRTSKGFGINGCESLRIGALQLFTLALDVRGLPRWVNLGLSFFGLAFRFSRRRCCGFRLSFFFLEAFLQCGVFRRALHRFESGLSFGGFLRRAGLGLFGFLTGCDRRGIGGVLPVLRFLLFAGFALGRSLRNGDRDRRGVHQFPDADISLSLGLDGLETVVGIVADVDDLRNRVPVVIAIAEKKNHGEKSVLVARVDYANTPPASVTR